MQKPLKPYFPTADLIQKLTTRGMAVDPELAERWLDVVGYYRLSGYWYSYREQDGSSSSQRLDTFMAGTSFGDIAALYEFDRKLRGHMLDGLERVEVALRSSLNEELGALGPLAYMNPSNFRRDFDHRSWLDTAERRIKRAAKSSGSIQHYAAKYGGSYPLWVLADHLDFADSSRLLEGLPARRQWSVAERLGIEVDRSKLSGNQRTKVSKIHPLVRWFEQLTIVRNTGAHHSRLWNRSFTPVGTAGLKTDPVFSTLPDGQSERLYGAALLTAQILTTVSPGSSWADKFRGLLTGSLETIALRSAAELGCPAGWDSDPNSPFAP